MNSILNKTSYIYLVQVLTSFSCFIFAPFFAVWLFDEKLLSVSQSALVVGLYLLTIRLSAIFLARLVESRQKKTSIMIGFVFMALAYLTMLLMSIYHLRSFAAWAMAALVLGSSISTIRLALAVLMSLNTKPEYHQKGFSFINVAMNLGGGAGSMLGGLLLAYHPYLLVTTSFVLAFIGIASSVFLPQDQSLEALPQDDDCQQPKGNALLFYLILFVNFLLMMAYAQFYDIFPAYAKGSLSLSLIGTLFFMGSLVIVFLQFPVNRLTAFLKVNTTIALGAFLFCVGTLMLIFAKTSLLICIVGVVLLSLGEMMLIPLARALTVKYSPRGNPTMSLAMLTFSWGVSESLMTFTGLMLVGFGLGVYSFLIGAGAVLLIALLMFLPRVRFL